MYLRKSGTSFLQDGPLQVINGVPLYRKNPGMSLGRDETPIDSYSKDGIGTLNPTVGRGLK